MCAKVGESVELYDRELIPPVCEELSLQSLRLLYDFTDWRVILLDKRMRRMYGDFSTVSLFKALALPYLVNLPSERALERAIIEREPLQTLCGFAPGKVPGRGTLWNFRRKYGEVYSELMLRVLITIVLSGVEPSLGLPFVRPIPAVGTPQGSHFSFQLDRYRFPIKVWTTSVVMGVLPEITVVGKTLAELWHEVKQREEEERQRSSRKKGLSTGLGLPAEVRTTLYGGQEVCFAIYKPDWLDSPSRQTDTLTGIGPASFRPYAACHVLVIRKHENQQQVLLSRRVTGLGKGRYALPGGKKHPDESLEECAKRELLEEAGIRILRSRPVSWHRTRLPGKPEVYSVGALAEEYEGEPQHLEPSQNTEWEWFDLDSLSVPLFEPTHIVIHHFIRKKYPDLHWSDVESQVPEAQQLPEQLALPIDV